VVSVVNAPFAADAAVDSFDAGLPIWQNPKARELLRTALGGLAVLLLIFTVLRPAFRQLLAPKVHIATIVDDDAPVALSPAATTASASGAASARGGAPALMNFDDKLEVARTAVSTDPKRVAQVVRDWVESDG